MSSIDRARTSAATCSADRGRRAYAGARRLDRGVRQAVQPVGDLERLLIGEHSLGLEAVEQCSARTALDGQRELPGEVVSVVQAGVESLSAERA